MSTHLIKEFSNPMTMSTMTFGNKMFKCKKFESLETNSTEEELPLGEEEKFIMSYKNDLIFRKKVDFLIK